MRVREAHKTDLGACARIACDSEIGRRYGFRPEVLEAKMEAALASGALILVAESDPPGSAAASGAGSAGSDAAQGFAWIDPRGAFGSSPYLKLIAVDPAARSSGIGAELLRAYEAAARSGRLYTLLVSDFNEKAIAFYERHGYREAGRLPGFAVPGITEILMIKERP